MSIKLDQREVLKYLNYLGYYNITSEQLKQFTKDLKKLIKYEQKKQNEQENVEKKPKPKRESKNKHILSEHEIDNITKQLNTNTNPNRNYCSPDIFDILHKTSTVSSRAKTVTPSEQQNPQIISVEILRTKKPKPTSSRASSCSRSIEKNVLETKTNTIQPTKRSESRTSENLRPKVSFIRPHQPLRTMKSDPVALYQQYQSEWKKQKLPGEDNHYDLRWAIRERMLGQPDIEPTIPMERILRKQNRI